MSDVRAPGFPRRLLLVSINYLPEMTGIGKYSGEMAEWLASRGVEVEVVTAPPYYPAWKVSPEYGSYLYRRETINGVGITRCPLWVPARPSGLKRILHLASFALSAFPVIVWKAVRMRPDIVFVVEPPLFCAPSALLAAGLGGAQSWLHVQDFEVDAAFDLGVLKARWLRKLVLKTESWLMRRFARVTTISERMLERLSQKGVEPERVGLLPNWVELERIYPLQEPSSLRAEWGMTESDTVVLYSGNMGEKQGLEILLETARRLEDRSDIRFVLCGDGSARARLEVLAGGMRNVEFKPLQPLDRLNDLLNLADIHVLPQRGDAADLVLPSKLTNMLASARPVVATAAPGTQVAEIVEACGIVVPPEDADALARAVAQLSDSAAKRSEFGAAARRLAETDWGKDNVLSRVFGR
ncbi:glycosyltransferase [Thiohalobacter thiocyanaticus]|uniref:Glycosyltransferase n=1 Tax=Thiohalobacter thiocyanaticus TaxID=585455 RepID=A0A1Z4VMY7_9GAMM|nr:glycosyltransferase WbuB [Thiohalobacter thiocyanaticus]BAZ92990.1 glycosyltransferase [Thiohalobacter thiocyanaticus]